MTADSACFHWYHALDANFDGYMDFGYTFAMGNMPYYDHLWMNELAEIYLDGFPSESGGWLDAQMAWYDLDYHGKPGGNGALSVVHYYNLDSICK